jgi:hypothetical protein
LVGEPEQGIGRGGSAGIYLVNQIGRIELVPSIVASTKSNRRDPKQKCLQSGSRTGVQKQLSSQGPGVVIAFSNYLHTVDSSKISLPDIDVLRGMWAHYNTPRESLGHQPADKLHQRRKVRSLPIAPGQQIAHVLSIVGIDDAKPNTALDQSTASPRRGLIEPKFVLRRTNLP